MWEVKFILRKIFCWWVMYCRMALLWKYIYIEIFARRTRIKMSVCYSIDARSGAESYGGGKRYGKMGKKNRRKRNVVANEQMGMDWFNFYIYYNFLRNSLKEESLFQHSECSTYSFFIVILKHVYNRCMLFLLPILTQFLPHLLFWPNRCRGFVTAERYGVTQ